MAGMAEGPCSPSLGVVRAPRLHDGDILTPFSAIVLSLPSDVPDGFLGLAHFKKHTQSCGVIGHDVKSPSGDRLRVIPSRWV
jgi:hypothetical protein